MTALNLKDGKIHGGNRYLIDEFKMRGAYKAFIKTLLFTAISVFLISYPAHCAEIKVGSLIRDAEIEDTMNLYMTQLFKASGQDISKLKLYIIHDPAINAYASLGHTLVVNTGLIMKCDNVGQLIGVLAHETGHIAGTHVVKSYGEMQTSQTVMIASMLLGAAAGVLAGRSDIAAAITMGGMQVGQANFLSFTRAHENAADQAAAKYLDRLGWSSAGLYEMMQKFESQELLSSERQDPYMRTHPLTKERVNFFQHHSNKNKEKGLQFPPDFEEKFQRMKTKMTAYVNNPQAVLNKISSSDHSLEAKYARCIAYFRTGEFDKSSSILEDLIEQHPKDPYFKELKAQMRFERGDIPGSIELYQEAIKYSNNSKMMQTVYGLALIESPQRKHHEMAIPVLETACKYEPENPFVWRLLATAYGKLNQTGKADLMIAKQEILLGNYDRAKGLAKRAKNSLHNIHDILMANEIINDNFDDEDDNE